MNPRAASYPEPCETGYGCGFSTPAPYDLYFLATLPPLGSATYEVSSASLMSSNDVSISTHTPTASATASFSISNGVMQLTFANSTGSLISVTHLPSQLSTNITAMFVEYVPATLNVFNNSEGVCRARFLFPDV